MTTEASARYVAAMAVPPRSVPARCGRRRGPYDVEVYRTTPFRSGWVGFTILPIVIGGGAAGQFDVIGDQVTVWHLDGADPAAAFGRLRDKAYAVRA
ncbi:hypothetical protein Vwe01_12710 [Micromonospora andamanensis]|nr:hypothetical protein Vwe01_12710 [Micromonospora andamanensis]